VRFLEPSQKCTSSVTRVNLHYLKDRLAGFSVSSIRNILSFLVTDLPFGWPAVLYFRSATFVKCDIWPRVSAGLGR